jgi:hypothetical protein
VIDHVKDLSLEKLNKIPHGLNNNIIWNLGHLVAAQQSICYLKGGLKPPLQEDSYDLFMPGTRPERFFDNDEEDEIKALLISSVDLLQKDIESNYFDSFVPWTNRYGITLNNIEDAINYIHFHDGLHVGVIMNMRKLIQK